jgi:hypothetical protein
MSFRLADALVRSRRVITSDFHVQGEEILMLSTSKRLIVTVLLLTGLAFAWSAGPVFAQRRAGAGQPRAVQGQPNAANGNFQRQQAARQQSGSQGGGCQGQQSGGSTGSGSLSSTAPSLTTAQPGTDQVQNQIQQQIAYLQNLLTQFQNGQIALPTNSSVTSSQAQAVIQQRINVLRSLSRQLANRSRTLR